MNTKKYLVLVISTYEDLARKFFRFIWGYYVLQEYHTAAPMITKYFSLLICCMPHRLRSLIYWVPNEMGNAHNPLKTPKNTTYRPSI